MTVHKAQGSEYQPRRPRAAQDQPPRPHPGTALHRPHPGKQIRGAAGRKGAHPVRRGEPDAAGGPRKSFVILRRAEFTQQVVGISEPRISSRITGIVHNRLREEVERPVQAFRRPLIPLVPPTQVEVVAWLLSKSETARVELQQMANDAPESRATLAADAPTVSRAVASSATAKTTTVASAVATSASDSTARGRLPPANPRAHEQPQQLQPANQQSQALPLYRVQNRPQMAWSTPATGSVRPDRHRPKSWRFLVPDEWGRPVSFTPTFNQLGRFLPGERQLSFHPTSHGSN